MMATAAGKTTSKNTGSSGMSPNTTPSSAPAVTTRQEEDYINLWETTSGRKGMPESSSFPNRGFTAEVLINKQNCDEDLGIQEDDDGQERQRKTPQLQLLYEEKYNLEGQLKTISTHIQFTKTSLVSLNNEFGSIMHPPKEYLSEYKELTDKLNAFQVEEDKLSDQLHDISSSIASLEKSLEIKRLQQLEEHPRPHSATASVPETMTSSIAGSSSTGSSPLGLIRASLPNSQRTTVPARAGSSLRDVLTKAMRRRKLRTECTFIYRKVGSSTSSSSKSKKELVDWTADSAAFAGQELLVELIVDPSIMNTFTTSISHNFMRKTFFSLTFCDVCSRILFQGIRCDVCAFKFHPKCGLSVPNLCQPVSASGSTSTTGVSQSSRDNVIDSQGYFTTSSSSQVDSYGTSGRNVAVSITSADEDVNNVNFYSHLLAMNSLRATPSSKSAKKKKKKKKRKMAVWQTREDSSTDYTSTSGSGLASCPTGSTVVDIPDDTIEDEESRAASSRERSTSAPNVHLVHPKNSKASVIFKSSQLFTQPNKGVKPPNLQSSSAATTPTMRGAREVASAAAASKASQFFFASAIIGTSVTASSAAHSSITTPVKGVVKDIPTSGVTTRTTSPPNASPSAQMKDKSTSSRSRSRSADESANNRIHACSEGENATAAAASKNKTAVRKVTSSQIEDWEIPEDEIVYGERIGSGSFGTVYKGSWHGPIALKKLNVFKDQKPTQSQLVAFKNEVAVLRFVVWF